MGLVSELRRRNVLRMAVLYAVAAWLVMQVAEVVIGLANLPNWIGPTILLLLAIGFPIALVFSWFYELTPEGISLEKDIEPSQSVRHASGRRVDFIVIALLVAAVIMFAYDKWWTPGPSDKSIAVLAFENMSDDPDQEYFSDGISEELLNLLAKIPELHVTSRSSAFTFKGAVVDIPTIAEQLNVAHVLEGSVRREGNRVRVTAQLIDAKSDSHLWSESYDRDLNDIFAVQNEIAEAISRELKVKLVRGSAESALPKVIQATTSDAYDAYLKGREFVNLRDEESLWRAGHHFERALRLDRDFAPAHAQLAIATLLSARKSREDEWESSIETATEHLDRALELDTNLADAHGGRALLALELDDLESAIEHAKKALVINPSYVDAMNWLQGAYYRLGQYAESDRIVEEMIAIDPLTVVGRAHQIDRLNLTGQHLEAHKSADRLLAQSPAWAYREHARTSLFFEGNIAVGLFWSLKLGQETGYDFGQSWQAFYLVGEHAEARRLYDEADFFIDSKEQRWDEVFSVVQEALQLYPQLTYFSLIAGNASYRAQRFDEALEHYERYFNSIPQARLTSLNAASNPVFESFPVINLMRLAHTRRETGDETGAQATAKIARQGNAALRAAGRNNNNRNLAEAMIAAFDGQTEAAVSALELAVGNGLRARFLDEPIFSNIRAIPEFLALRAELDSIIAAERDSVLQLVCFDNPIPNDWQPLPATCEGLVERPTGP